jgi:hypothetical protein
MLWLHEIKFNNFIISYIYIVKVIQQSPVATLYMHAYMAGTFCMGAKTYLLTPKSLNSLIYIYHSQFQEIILQIKHCYGQIKISQNEPSSDG